MGKKRLRYQLYAPSRSEKEKLKLGNYITWREDIAHHRFYDIEQTFKVVEKFPLLQIVGRKYVYTVDDLKCYPIDPRGKQIRNIPIFGDVSFFRKLRKGELETIQKRMNLFNIYRPILIPNHPFTRIFK